MDHVSVLKPKVVSVGLSVCRVNSGEIVVAAHDGTQRIMLELSLEECAEFAGKLSELCEQFRSRPNVVSAPVDECNGLFTPTDYAN